MQTPLHVMSCRCEGHVTLRTDTVNATPNGWITQPKAFQCSIKYIECVTMYRIDLETCVRDSGELISHVVMFIKKTIWV